MSTTESSGIYTGEDYTIIHNTSETVNVGELESLIHVLKDKIMRGDPQIRTIKYPNLLMSSLVELNGLVGMDRLKDSIALQVMRLIDGASNGEKSNRMLNTILYGPPGVGKTKVGIILAKIWFSLGYLKRPKISNTGCDKGSCGDSANNTTTTTITGMDGGAGINPFVTILLLVVFYGFTYILWGANYVYNRFGLAWLGFIVLFIALIILLMYYNKSSYNYITSIVTTNNEQPQPKIDDRKIQQINDRDLIKVVSRADFVAQYLGQTAPKTKALLYANMGKVLFIDEAYSLFNGERDQFGMEALTTLNLFMSEHPDSIAVIIAGYKDLMKYGIFKVQPGLPRRCMWHFECTGYDGEELADIFYRQVYNDGWAIKKSDYPAIRRLISDNKDIFKSYGGDTERLLFFSQLEASRHNVMTSSSSSYSVNGDGTTFTNSNDDSDMTRSNHGSSCSSNNSNTYSSVSSYNTNSSSNEIKQSEYRGKILTYRHVQHGLRRLEENNINQS